MDGNNPSKISELIAGTAFGTPLASYAVPKRRRSFRLRQTGRERGGPSPPPERVADAIERRPSMIRRDEVRHGSKWNPAIPRSFVALACGVLAATGPAAAEPRRDPHRGGLLDAPGV